MCNPLPIRIFSLTDNKHKQHLTALFDEDMTVSFNNDKTVSEIEHHCEFTSKERMSIWYTDDDYRSFNLQETQEQLSGPLAAKIDKIERSRHIVNVQYLVLRAQMVQREIAKTDTNETEQDYSKWLADFYQLHSESCAIAARQRGLENDLCLLNIKLRDTSLMLLRNSFLFNGLSVSNNNNNNNNNNNDKIRYPGLVWRPDQNKNNNIGALANNERWSVEEGSTNSNKRVAFSKSSRNFRRMLCKDLDLSSSSKKIVVTEKPIFFTTSGFTTSGLTSLESATSGLTSLESIVSPIGCLSRKNIPCGKEQGRWCPISRKADSNVKDLPLKPIRRQSLTPPIPVSLKHT